MNLFSARFNSEGITTSAVRRSSLATVALSFLLVLGGCNGTDSKEFDYLYKDLPFEMGKVSRPVIPARTVLLTDFGGNGNGVDLNTQAFADAISHLSALGGGHLEVPAGIWHTGPIELQSNIDLHLAANAIIIFSTDKDLYPIIETSFEGLDTKRCESPIHADGQHDISITGQGVIDGNGGAWRSLKRSKVNSSQWKAKLASGGVLSEDGSTWYPDASYPYAEGIANMNVPPKDIPDSVWVEIKTFLRPVMVSLRNCENVLLEGCTFQNSPAWNIHPLMCKNLIVKDLTVRNPSYAQNGDGIDVESCEDVVIVDSSFDCGDDGICIKSGKDEDGRRRGVPCRNLIVDNCTVYHGHGGFVVGSEMSGGVENMKVTGCRFLGTDVGLRFKSKRGRGGVVSNIYIDNIYMTDIATETVLFDLFYMGKSAVEALADGDNASTEPQYVADETTPAFRDIYIKDICCNGARRAMYFNGLPEMPVRNINIEGCSISSTYGIEINWSEDITLRNVNVVPAKGEKLVTSHVKNLTVE